MLKILVIGVVLFFVYLVFFKKNRERDIRSKKDNENPNQLEDVMNPCPTCGTYIVKEDAILSSGQYYCSTECLPK